MNLVRSAMRRPLTVMVMILAVALGAFLGLREMTRDIFPPLGIPTIYLAQPYGGMDPAQMEGYLTYYYEFQFFFITSIEHIESRSIQGAAVLKLQFHPGTDMAQALAETVNYAARARAYMPPGTVPPFIMRFDAGSVPIGNLVFSSQQRPVSELQDLALNRVRPLFATLPGVSAPPPFGGSARTIVVNLDPDRLRAHHLSPDHVVTAISAANVVSPSGNINLGDRYPIVPVNAVVRNIHELETVPIRTGTYPTVFLRDLGTVEDGADVVTCLALVNGRRTVYIPVTKRADASTLSVVREVKQHLPRFQEVLPDDVQVTYEFDQSLYVTRAIEDLLKEGVLGALLAGLMVRLFLRDWRSAAVVILNIPLSLLGAVLALWICKQNVNLMTLGGLALAVGILVDGATVTMENIHTHRLRGKNLARAALEGTAETALPQMLAMLCIVAVFLPTLFMTGAGRALFVPLALAVGFSMVASFLLSMTLIPILSVWVVGPRSRLTDSSLFARFRESYARRLYGLIQRPRVLVAGYLGLCAALILSIGSGLGVEIFPRVDVGQLQLRLRAPTGTRLERTEAITLAVLEAIKREVGPENLAVSLAFIGVHSSSYPVNLIYLWNSGPEEAVVQVQLKHNTPPHSRPPGASSRRVCEPNAGRKVLL